MPLESQADQHEEDVEISGPPLSVEEKIDCLAKMLLHLIEMQKEKNQLDDIVDAVYHRVNKLEGKCSGH